jgi:hypothetical protein
VAKWIVFSLYMDRFFKAIDDIKELNLKCKFVDLLLLF